MPSHPGKKQGKKKPRRQSQIDKSIGLAQAGTKKKQKKKRGPIFE